jgi:N-acetylglucosamine kinase-like BadF-type ATPase
MSSVDRPYLLGVDGGGTSTVAWISDLHGNVLARAVSGPSNSKAVGLEAARQALIDAITCARAAANLSAQPALAACFGLAGLDRGGEKRDLQAWVQEMNWADRLVLVNDGDLLLAAGTPEGWGIGAISGTGSIVVGRAPTGAMARAGGWGHLFGDEGSGYWVVLEALRRLARVSDGREPGGEALAQDPLCVKFLHDQKVDRPSDLVTAIYADGVDRARLARMAPLVTAAADEGSGAAREILDRAALELARAVIAVHQSLDLKPTEPYPLVLAGSFLLSSHRVATGLLGQLEQSSARPASVTPVPDPVFGALTLARRALGT